MHHPIQMKPADSENRNGEYDLVQLVIVARKNILPLEKKKLS